MMNNYEQQHPEHFADPSDIAHGQPEHGDSGLARALSDMQITDQFLHEEVTTVLRHDHLVDSKSLKVAVEEGHVTIEGRVRHQKAAELATQRVELIAGVKSVQNNLAVGPPMHQQDES